MQDIELLSDVLLIKETFYRSALSHYERCNTGGLRLIPDAQLLDALHKDCQAMLGAQMLNGETPLFEEIVQRLQDA